MNQDTLIRDLFESDITRDIPPVVYFHEQSPEKLAAEVSEFIITGGWPENHPYHRRVPNGIHEQYVKLLTNIVQELEKPGGPELPTSWISGFYGSGKSSFAKLLGLALDGVALPDGTSLSEAWLKRDTSPNSAALRDAWNALRRKVEPLAVVFDIGATARGSEHIHEAAVRQLQLRLGYCSTEPLVAEFELRLERDNEWQRFEQVAEQELGGPWSEFIDREFAEDDFSRVLHVMYPERYSDPMSWINSRAGIKRPSESPEDAVLAIRDMIKFRKPGATVFFVVDEVSQYVLSNKDRVDKLRAFATALGASLKGDAWLLALGQQKLDQEADDSFLVWAKDRFPAKLQVHLAATNIRDVVHKRLLRKREDVRAPLQALFEKHRPQLKAYAYGCESDLAEEFVEVYPLLPGQIDLILQITSALRTRSARAQGDDQAIRGLLQLLGELFREIKLADQPVGSLITLDQIYEVQHTALDSDVQTSMARVLAQCSETGDEFLVRVAKAVALLELIQETTPTKASLVAQCLYDRVDLGNNKSAVTDALEELRKRNLLSFSEKTGYKLQSSAGEEWESERSDPGVTRERISEIVQERLKRLLAQPNRPSLEGRPFPWAAEFSDGRGADGVSLLKPQDPAVVFVDFRFLVQEARIDSSWIKRSGETEFNERLVWVCGDNVQVDHLARELFRSRRMVNKYKAMRNSMLPAKRLLLQQEESRSEDLEKAVGDAVAAAWMNGKMYFRGRGIVPLDHGSSFSIALHSLGNRVLPDLFPHFSSSAIQPSELLQLFDAELAGPSPKFRGEELGILELDAGRYVPTCAGVVPQRIKDHIDNEGGLGGATLLSHFGGPPYGYTPNVVKACVAGLLRASKVRVLPDGGKEITAVRDFGVRELFESDRAFRRATIFPAGDDEIGYATVAKICNFFKERFDHTIDREQHLIADGVVTKFPQQAQSLREVYEKLDRLSYPPVTPEAFAKLQTALEKCIASSRQTTPTVKLVKRYLDELNNGISLVRMYDSELTEDAIRSVNVAHGLVEDQFKQLTELGVDATNVAAAAERARKHLASNMPWREISSLDEDLEAIRSCYHAERGRLLQWQGNKVDETLDRVKRRAGYGTLTREHAQRVIQPLQQACTETDAEAVAPVLTQLQDPFELRLQRAEHEANERLDEILSQGDKPLIKPFKLNLNNRELTNEADVDALLDDIKQTLLEELRAGARIRLL